MRAPPPAHSLRRALSRGRRRPPRGGSGLRAAFTLLALAASPTLSGCIIGTERPDLNLEIADAPGNLSLRTNSYDVSIENAGGKVKVENRNGNVEVRFSSPPKEDIEITNSSAGISLSLPESSSFDIVADCHSGDIDSEFSSDALKKTSTQSGDSHLEGKYGNGRGPKITLKTSYGSIAVRRISSDISAPPVPPRPKAPPAPPKPEKP